MDRDLRRGVATFRPYYFYVINKDCAQKMKASVVDWQRVDLMT